MRRLRLGMMAGGIPLDPDAVAFLVAAGITDGTITSAINTLVIDLKLYGIWTKMKAIYPFVGGTATTHKFNLKNPADSDAAYRLLFAGGWTHSANGALPNGANAYADTFLNANTMLTNASNHLSYYSRTSSTAGVRVEIGCAIGINVFHLRSAVNYIAGDLLTVSLSDVNAQGFWIGSKENSASRKGFKNASLIQLVTTNNTTLHPSLNIFIGARNENGVPAFFSDKQAAFASIGDGISTVDAINYYTAVQAFQTTLGRQV